MATPGKLTRTISLPLAAVRSDADRADGVASAAGTASITDATSTIDTAASTAPTTDTGGRSADSTAATEPTPQPGDSSDDSTESPATTKSPRRTLTRAAALALTAATAFAAWSAWSWHTAATSPTATAGTTRDEAVAAGRTLITTVTTFDPQHRDQDLARWQAATTGALQTSLPGTVPPSGSAITGHVLDAGLSDLDPQAGTAKLLASVEITVTKDGTPQPTRRTRLAATLAHTASGWKLSALEQLGVAGS
ncbi:hypothetical protein [Amycolatopsis silviterrae]|uniref:Mce-associated membrane protein n=1 Tax=Amycolatopsis silviterrae TaxID=1656914 RepID=A0ABW5H8S4_9PSEU